MKVVLDGESFDWDAAKAPMSEALWVEHVYKRRYAEWQEDLSAGSAKAMCVLACLIWRRDGRDVPLQDLLDGRVDFDLMEMLGSMAESAEAEAKAAAEAEAAEPVPYASRVGPGWHTWDQGSYLGIFAETFGWTPAQIGELTTDEFDALVGYLHETGKLGD